MTPSLVTRTPNTDDHPDRADPAGGESRDNARSAVSHYEVVRRLEARFGRFSLVRVALRPAARRIPVHMASIGHPVVGDTLLWRGRIAQRTDNRADGPEKRTESQKIRLGRNFLHAAELEFAHPITGKPLALQSPLPAELEHFLKRLKTRAK